jgi:hypothetical protein
VKYKFLEHPQNAISFCLEMLRELKYLEDTKVKENLKIGIGF